MQYLKSTVGERACGWRTAARTSSPAARRHPPEDKRAIIGETFIAVKEDEFARLVSA